MGGYFKTLVGTGPFIVERWRQLVGLFVSEVLGLFIASFKFWDPNSREAHLLDALPWWVYALAFAAFLVVALFMALHDMRVQRDDLKKLTNYEKAIDRLGVLYDEGTALLNYALATENELIAWEGRWDQWREAVENSIGENFGPGERALFHSSVLFKDHGLDGVNAVHSNRRSQLVHKLELLKALMLRHGEKASLWRRDADAA